MKIVPCVQGSPEWHAARRGIPTASQFHRLLTPKTLKPSAQAEKYLNELLAERFLDTDVSPEATPWMHRGNELEPYAARWYAFDRGVVVQEVGFVADDEFRYGCSPDRLVGDDGGLEIKCPSAAVHMAHLRAGAGGVDREHHLQVQGCLFVCERSWWDCMSYNEELDPIVVRVERDGPTINALASALGAFAQRLEEETRRLERQMGRQAHRFGEIVP